MGEQYLLSAVVPVSRMSGRLDLLSQCISDCLPFSVQIILVHDIADLETSSELDVLLSSIGNSKVVLIEGFYGNPGSARNEGLKLAEGEWIAFWDSDDAPHVQEILKTIIEDKDSDILVGDFIKRDNLGKTLPSVKLDNQLLTIAANPGIWRFVFRKEVLRDSRFPPLRMGEDQVFLSRLGIMDKSVGFSRRIFYTYSIGNPYQLTNNKKKIQDISKSLKMMGKLRHIQGGENFMLTSYLYYSSGLTGLRRGNFKTRTLVLGNLIKEILWALSQRATRKPTLSQLFDVIKFKFKL